MVADEKTLSQIMKTCSIPEYTALNENDIDVADKEEVVCTEVGKNVRVDLVKLAFYHVQGYSTGEIAKILGLVPRTVVTLKSSDKFKNIVALLNAEIVSTARTFLTASGLKAVITLIKCLDSSDDKIKIKAATEVLDRIGMNTVNKVELVSKSDRLSHMSEEELMAVIKMGMSELSPKKTEVVNAEDFIEASTGGSGEA